MKGPQEHSIRFRPFLLGVALTTGLGVVQGLRAQVADSAVVDTAQAAAIDAAVRAITPAELARHIAVLTADSLRVRTASGADLEATARYMAAQFRALGLEPWRPDMPMDSAWLKRYPLPGNRRLLDSNASSLYLYVRLRGEHQEADAVNEDGRSVDRVVMVKFADAARLAADSVAESVLADPVRGALVVSGRHTAATVSCDKLRRTALLYVPPAGLDTAVQRAVVARLTACAPVMVVAAEDSAAFATRRIAAASIPTAFFQDIDDTASGRYWAAAVDPRAAAPALGTAGLDLPALWADTTPRIRELPTLMVWPQLQFAEPRTVTDDAYGVYVVGLLRGSDTVGRHGATSYIVYSASMDRGGFDRPNGGHDTGPSLGALITLAKAFTQPGARPRRSVVFLATSGTRQRFAGTKIFLRPFYEKVLNIALDGLGDGRGDTVPVAGLSDFTFAQRPDWLAASHPELGLEVVDGGTALTPTSDHYAFARCGFVTLALGLAGPEGLRPGPGHRDSRAAADDASGGADGTNRLARVTRFAFHLGHDFASAKVWPKWAPAARDAWLNGVGR